ncbi:MAG: c-type cytochrome [Methylophilaceae bacterium]
MKILLGVIALLASTAIQSAEQVMPKYPPSYSLCVACHGIDGSSIKPHYPILAAQHKTYLYNQLVNFKDGKRQNSEMSVIAPMLSLDDIDKLTTYFSKAARIKEELPEETINIIEAKSKLTIATNQCFACHEYNSGDNTIPSIKGQKYLYILKQLQDFKSGKRLDSSGKMEQVVLEMSDADMQEIDMNISKQVP